MDTLARFLPALRSQSASMRLRAARELRHFIESESRDLSHGHYLKWVGEISAKLMELCNSADTLERMGGIAAMDELVELFIAERNDQTIIEFAHSLTKVFEKIPAADSATLRVASKALGHIVSTGGTSLIEFVEDYHVKPALEWLANDTYHVRRHAAVMILKELSVNAPSTSFRYIDRYFDIIWSAFWDARVVVRVSASESLQTCISLIQQREYSRRSLLYKKAYDEAMRSLQRGTSDAAHGALLIINELLRNTGDFMHHHYNDVCKVVFNLLEHKSPSVKSAVISIFPRLAKFNTSLFLETWFDPLLAQNDNLRCLFIALNDEIFEIRQTAMSMLGRLTHHNPAMVLPSLRQTLVQLLTELEFSGDTRESREDVALRQIHYFIEALERHSDELSDDLIKLRVQVYIQLAFARDLRFAKEWTNLFEKTQNIDDLNQAWDIYYTVFSKIRKQLANLSTLELANVGPKLLSVQDLSLAVPGTYKSGAPIVRIMSFDSKVTVLTSKQRPRKVTINGSDGKAYPFLLKGHEDLRQDERVMQLFGVINTLLANDSDTSKRNLAIERYSVLPLSHTSGLIGWVPNCDTLHQLIRDYREKRKIQLNVEHRLMVQMAPDYDKLPLMQKVEAFKFALGETTGQDLYRVLWLKSRDSEVWLDRRRNYTRSLAVMSMAGYILGLGDRHPSNLMLDRVSGKMVHIDFGDCFEVAMERDKYPEKIPFRLTRMLTQAMEVSGIEGNFRYTCEASMRVLRDNRDSLMAVLEAFVYDPLINWRLLKKDTVPSHARPEEEDGVVNPTETRDGVGGRANSASGPQEPGSVVNSNADDDRSSVKSAPSAPPTPRRRRTSSNDGMFGFAIDPLDPTSLARNSIKEAQRDHDSKTIGQSVITAELPQLNEKALSVVDRVKKKLAGRDFDDGERVLSVDEQVDRLIMQATSHENLCQLYYGWCPFW
ncbi:hypothetical protein ATCC90586_001621 [Pythium insidiosum]|nr:hypothetical protein ATCC90586_001621 [Pythium insidiosum]